MSEHCIICGAEIPEGRQVCPMCGNDAVPFRDKVISTLRRCSGANASCISCPYVMNKKVRCVEQLMKDAITLLETERKDGRP